MKIIFEKYPLIETLTPAMCAVSTKNTFSSIEGVLIETIDSNSCRLSTYDMEKGVCATLSAKVEAEGCYIINAHKLFQIVRMMPQDTITLKVTDKLATITSGKSSFSLHALSGSDFPTLPELSGINENGSFSIAERELKRIISRTAHAIAIQDQRPMLCGGYFELDGEKLTVVACDSYTLAKCEVSNIVKDFDSKDTSLSFIVPGKSLNELQKMLSDSEDEVVVSLTRKHIIFKIKEITFFSRLIDSDYIDYKRIIPKEQPINVIIDRELFIDSLERAALVSEDKSAGSVRSYVKCSFGGNLLQISSTSINGKVYDEISCEHNGDEIEIGFNCKYLLENLRAATTEKVKIKLISPLMSMTIEPDISIENEDFLYMVLPVKMKE